MRLMIALLTGGLILFGPAPDGGAEPRRVVVATGEWAPYTSAGMEGRGVVSRIIDRVFERMGIDYELVFYPWPRCYESVTHGRVWGAFPYARTPEREKAVRFSEPIMPSASSLFYYRRPPSDFQFQTIADLEAYRVGGVRGYYYEALFKAAGVAIDYVDTPKQGFEKLVLGRNDLFVANELVGWYLIQQSFPDRRRNFGTLDRGLDHHGLHLIVGRSDPDSRTLLEAFNDALTAVKNELFYATMLDRLTRAGAGDGP